ncbi:hypothetical protein A0E43_02225 [Pectobacterium cacticida]
MYYSDSASHYDPDTSGEIQKARMAQALRAFLCPSLSDDIRLNPEIIGLRLGLRYHIGLKK